MRGEAARTWLVASRAPIRELPQARSSHMLLATRYPHISAVESGRRGNPTTANHTLRINLAPRTWVVTLWPAVPLRAVTSGSPSGRHIAKVDLQAVGAGR